MVMKMVRKISCLQPADPTGPAQPALTAVGGASLAPPLDLSNKPGRCRDSA